MTCVALHMDARSPLALPCSRAPPSSAPPASANALLMRASVGDKAGRGYCLAGPVTRPVLEIRSHFHASPVAAVMLRGWMECCVSAVCGASSLGRSSHAPALACVESYHRPPGTLHPLLNVCCRVSNGCSGDEPLCLPCFRLLKALSHTRLAGDRVLYALRCPGSTVHCCRPSVCLEGREDCECHLRVFICFRDHHGNVKHTGRHATLQHPIMSACHAPCMARPSDISGAVRYLVGASSMRFCSALSLGSAVPIAWLVE
ncbi:hypothetical protein CALVIDRAFT_137762 [Calocera viscosa TUFC12733]|uniref:Uncharacterized protein n=1 Tax=Calocera viscosa (strain TUFC12733) TaxID=1330018 RepID=A0A167M0E7_CALVF|nr:hypothetical protein CALVIDRAFT_137762 [Calocera viscosa TUFC12733]